MKNSKNVARKSFQIRDGRFSLTPTVSNAKQRKVKETIHQMCTPKEYKVTPQMLADRKTFAELTPKPDYAQTFRKGYEEAKRKGLLMSLDECNRERNELYWRYRALKEKVITLQKNIGVKTATVLMTSEPPTDQIFHTFHCGTSRSKGSRTKKSGSKSHTISNGRCSCGWTPSRVGL
jgi:hypothetical protein